MNLIYTGHSTNDCKPVDFIRALRRYSGISLAEAKGIYDAIYYCDGQLRFNVNVNSTGDSDVNALINSAALCGFLIEIEGDDRKVEQLLIEALNLLSKHRHHNDSKLIIEVLNNVSERIDKQG